MTVSRLLGHANPSITLDKYGHALSDHQRTSVEKLSGLYQGGAAERVLELETQAEVLNNSAPDFSMQF